MPSGSAFERLWLSTHISDHRHRKSGDKGVPYTFESASRLLEDFFAEVDRVIKGAQQ